MSGGEADLKADYRFAAAEALTLEVTLPVIETRALTMRPAAGEADWIILPLARIEDVRFPLAENRATEQSVALGGPRWPSMGLKRSCGRTPTAI